MSNFAITRLPKTLKTAIANQRYWKHPANPSIIGYADKKGKLIPGSIFGGGLNNNEVAKAEFARLAEDNKIVYEQIKPYLKDSTTVNLLLLRLGIKAVENKFDPKILLHHIYFLFENNYNLTKVENIDSLRRFGELLIDLGIKGRKNNFYYWDLFACCIDFPLSHPSLAKMKNIKVLELLINLGIKAAENKLNPQSLFTFGINPLLEQNPSLAKVKNIESLKQFGELLVNLVIKAVENKFDPGCLFEYGINALLEQNPSLAEVKNIENLKQFGELLVKLGIKSAENKFDPHYLFEYGINSLLDQNPSLVEVKNISSLKKWGDSLIRIGLKTSEYNRERVFELLSKQYKKFSLSQLEQYFSLADKIFSDHPRLGYPLLEGIFDAVDKGLLPKKLSKNIEASILHFIARMHSFEPILYKVYSQQGDKFIDEVLTISKAILADGFGQKDMDAIKQKYPDLDGDQLILSMIQTRIPLSGASFVSKKESLGLFRKMAECGDLRNHVPAYWKNIEIKKELTLSQIEVKEGEEVDNDGKIKAVIELLRSSERPKKEEVILALKEYLKGNLDASENKQKFMNIFLRYAGTGDLLGEKVDRLGDKDFYTLRLLEEIFKDKDNLTTLLAGMLGEIEKEDPKLLVTEVKKQPLGEPYGLAKVLKKNLPKIPSEERKVEAAAKILAKYSEMEIKQKLLPLLSDSFDLFKVIEKGLIKENKAVLSKKAVIGKLLADPLAKIRHEMTKFNQVKQEDKMELGFRAVKGIPYGLWGLNAGVCIATDVELWKDPSFKLIAITDKNSGIIAGFIHVYETVIDGKKILTIPGIEPSVEFLNNVGASQLYEQIEAVIKELAKLGGYDEIYLPTNTLIASNRTDIQKAIQKKKYPVKKLERSVNWNHVPKPYPFDEVYVIKG